MVLQLAVYVENLILRRVLSSELVFFLRERLSSRADRGGKPSAEDMGYAQQFAYMNEAFARLCSTEDAIEGVQAFF